MGENTYEFDGVVNKQTVALDILSNYADLPRLKAF